MNNTKIEYVHKTLNPVVGCPHGCPYCYARGQAKRQKQRCLSCYQFVPHPHLERLEQITPRQKSYRIFIDSMWDWNAKGVEDEWIEAILAKIRECKQHTFLISSKRPDRYDRFEYPENVWLGTSIAADIHVYRILELVRLKAENLKYVNIEPLHGEINSLPTVGWITVGAETGHRKGKIVPKAEWVDKILENARAEQIPVFVKNNLVRVLGETYRIQEFPKPQ